MAKATDLPGRSWRPSDSHLEPLADADLASVVPVDVSDELGPRLRMEVEAETHSLRAA